MFHGVGFDRPAGRFEEKMLREMLDGIRADQERIASIIAERTDLPQNDAEELFREAQTKTAEFARQRGIVHDIAYVVKGGRAALDYWLKFRGDEPGPLLVPVSKSGTVTLRRMTTQALMLRLRHRCKQGRGPTVFPARPPPVLRE